MSITIEEIKAKKSALEKSFLKDLKELETDAEIRIDQVIVRIDRHTYDEREKQKNNKKLRKLKGVMDVQIEINIADDPRSIDVGAGVVY